MAFTTTTVITSAAIATASPRSNETKLALQSGSSAMFIQCEITSKAQIDRAKIIRVWYACSSNSAASGLVGAQTHARRANYVDVIPAMGAGLSVIVSDLVVNAGGYLYIWIENATLPTGTTLTVIVNEF